MNRKTQKVIAIGIAALMAFGSLVSIVGLF